MPPRPPPPPPDGTCGVGTSYDEATGTCEIACDDRRRRMAAASPELEGEPPADAEADADDVDVHEIVSSFLAAHPALAAATMDGGGLYEHLVELGSLFRPPALK